MAGRTAVVLCILAVLAGFPSGLQGARKLTTTQMRENTQVAPVKIRLKFSLVSKVKDYNTFCIFCQTSSF